MSEELNIEQAHALHCPGCGEPVGAGGFFEGLQWGGRELKGQVFSNATAPVYCDSAGFWWHQRCLREGVKP